MISIPILHVDQPNKYDSDSIRIVESEFHKQYFGDFLYLPVYIKHRHFFTDPDQSARFYKSISTSLQDSGLDFNLTGKLPAEREFRELIKRDFLLYLVLSLGISVLILLLLYRRAIFIFLPVLVGIFSLVIVFSIMALLLFPISIMSVLLPPLLLFTSTSDTIHLLNAVRRFGLENGIKKVIKPTFLTSITTALGFLSLLWINVEPVRQFGTAAAVGVLVAFFLTYSIVPFILHRGSSKSSANQKTIHFINPLRYKKRIGIIGSLILLLSLFGTTQLEIDAYLLDDLPDRSAIKGSFQRMDETLGGSKPWLLLAWTDKGRIWDENKVKSLKKIEKFLVNKYGIERLITPLSAFEYSRTIYPDRQDRAIDLAKTLSRNFSDTSMIFSGFIPEIGSKATMERNNEFREFLDQSVEVKNLHARITGTTYLIDKSHHLLSEKLIYGLITAVLTVSVFLGIFFRSWKWGLIALIPNLLTLIVIAGIIGLLGIPLQLSNAIIFSVAFGVVVDDTIHFIASYRQLERSKSRSERIVMTLNNTGSSILYTSVVIMSGFAIFLFSSFGATFYMGLFMVLAVLIALLVDLIFLPVILPKD